MSKPTTSQSDVEAEQGTKIMQTNHHNSFGSLVKANRGPRAIAFDLETHLITDTVKFPKPISFAFYGPKPIGQRLTLIDKGPEVFKIAFFYARKHGLKIVMHNARFDLGVLMEHYPELRPYIITGLDEGIFSDTLIRERLHRIHINRGGRNKLSLGHLVERYFGVELDKGDDGWRTRYAELENTPISQWPARATKYAIDDVVYTLRLWHRQRTTLKATTDEAHQLRVSVAAGWIEAAGIMTDEAQIQSLYKKYKAIAAEAKEKLLEAGILTRHLPKKIPLNKSTLTDLVVEILGEAAPKTKKGSIQLSKPVLLQCLQKSGDTIFQDALEYKAKFDFRSSEDSPLTDDEHLLIRKLQGRSLLPQDHDFSKAPAPTLTSNKKAIQGRVLAVLGSKAPRTDKGAIKTGADVVAECDDDPVLKWVVAYNKATSLQTKYLDKLTNGPIWAQFNTLMSTGRWSVSNPPLQQIPRGAEFRDIFIARPRKKLLCGDFSQIELVAIADICFKKYGFSNLRDAINAGIDAHVVLAVELAKQGGYAGNTYDKFMALYKHGTDKEKALYADLRQRAKAGNFGFPGGMGVPTFIKAQKKNGLVFDEAGADLVKQTWLNTWSEMTRHLDDAAAATNATDKHGLAYITAPMTGRVRGCTTFSQAANTLFQGLAADGMGFGQYLIMKETMTKGSILDRANYHTVLVVHDEVVGECDEAYAEAVAERLQQLMIQGMSKFITETKITINVQVTDKWLKG